MKKILFLVLISLVLVSCGKTPFKELSEEKQFEIESSIQAEILAPYMQEVMALAFNFDISDEEKNEKVDTMTDEMKVKVKEYLSNNYPDVEFDFEEMSKIDNSKEDIPTNIQEEKDYVSVPLGDFHSLSAENGEDTQIQIRVNDIVWKGKEYGDEWLKYTADNEFLFIRLEAENIGKNPGFIGLGGLKLITRDGLEFNNETSEQNPEDLKEGYSGCINCDMNPMEKAEEYVVFDIPKLDLTGAKLRFEDKEVDFEL